MERLDSKTPLKIDFLDFWTGFDRQDNQFVKLLAQKFEVRVCSDPDLIFFSCYGNSFRNYKGPRVFFSPENVRPDFTECDFAITFDYCNRPEHLRYPLYAGYAEGFGWWDSLTKLRSDAEIASDWEKKSEFCCMVVSNGNSRRRIDFFNKLSRHRPVASGGRYMNNVGGPIKDKLEFITKFRFVISFENSSTVGYTTEKIVEPLVTGCIPLYWGNEEIGRDFNTKRFIHCFHPKDDEAMISRIMEIDADEQLAMQVLREPVFPRSQIPMDANIACLDKFLVGIVHSIPNLKPVARNPMKVIGNLSKRLMRFPASLASNALGRQFR